MSDPATASISPRRMLATILIASSVSLVCGIITASVVFRIGGLERQRPFRNLYVDTTVGTAWKPISQYMLCTSIQWLMEVQSRTARADLSGLKFQSASAAQKAKNIDEQAMQLEQDGQAPQAGQLRRQAEFERGRSNQLQLEIQRLVGSKNRLYIVQYYKLIIIPLLVLWISVWIAAAYIPREVRLTNEIVKIAALVGLFHGIFLGILVILWSILGAQSLREYYLSANFYHGQWTGLWLYPVAGVILTGYLFGALAGWMAKGAERLRCAVLGAPVR